MVKKQNNNAWIVYVVVLIAVVALILGAVAINKANISGNAFWDFLRSEKNIEAPNQQQNQVATEVLGLVGEGFIANGGDVEVLKNYKVEYDENGDMIYEIKNNREIFALGEGYIFSEDEEGNNLIESLVNGNTIGDNTECQCKQGCTDNSKCKVTVTLHSKICSGGCKNCEGSCGWREFVASQ